MMFSAYKLNKQGDDIWHWCTPFPNLNQSIFLCLVLTVAWPAYRFLGRQISWSSIPISLRIFHSLLCYTQSKTSVESVNTLIKQTHFSWNRQDPDWQRFWESLKGQQDYGEDPMSGRCPTLQWPLRRLSAPEEENGASETEQNPVGLLGTKVFMCLPFLDYRKYALLSLQDLP